MNQRSADVTQALSLGLLETNGRLMAAVLRSVTAGKWNGGHLEGRTMRLKIMDDGGCEHGLSRDVRDVHPRWIHERLGTHTEAELQAALDQYRSEDFGGTGPQQRDCCGVFM